MKLVFKIDPTYLITHTLCAATQRKFSSEVLANEIIALQNEAWTISQPCYDIITGRFFPNKAIHNPIPKYQDIKNFMQQLRSTAVYQRLLTSTEQALQAVQAEWEQTFPYSYHEICSITQIDFSADSYTTLVTHPGLKNGCFLGNNTIAWTHRDDFSNYNTVYLWHEILHSKFEKDQISHAIIQLAAENELRLRMNKTTYPPFEGHEHLFSLMTQLLPSWQKYLRQETKSTILDYARQQQKARHRSKST